ncbi:MAG TPA: hypothetical protein DEU72_09525 [Desulfomicrobiaceae bacterium]|nr:hypothetical protein [Desulfomicrobiaceae bacterium]
MKNLKLGVKIGLGFALVLAIMATLGGITFFGARQVADGADHMANAYVPEVGIAADVQANTQSMMYAWSGYAFTKESGFSTRAAPPSRN